MTTATWRVTREDHNGNRLAPLDYTHKGNAQDHIRRLADLGMTADLWQYNQFTGEWTLYRQDSQ